MAREFDDGLKHAFESTDLDRDGYISREEEGTLNTKLHIAMGLSAKDARRRAEQSVAGWRRGAEGRGVSFMEFRDTWVRQQGTMGWDQAKMASIAATVTSMWAAVSGPSMAPTARAVRLESASASKRHSVVVESRREKRLASAGGNIMAHIFGDASATQSIGGFAVKQDGRITRETFETPDLCAAHYARRTLADGDDWLELLRAHRSGGNRWTDPDFSPDAGSIAMRTPSGRDPEWRRLSDCYQRVQYLDFAFLDEDGALGDNSARCYGFDPEWKDAPTNVGPDSDSEVGAAFVERASVIVRKIVAGSPLLSETWQGGAEFIASNVTRLLERFPLPLKEIGKGYVAIDHRQALGKARINVSLELRFEERVSMFNRPEEGGAHEGTIKQGALKDLYFLCGLSILSTHRNLLVDMLPDVPPELRGADLSSRTPTDEQQFNPGGVYAVRFWCDGEWRVVAVDDYVPVDERGAMLFAAASDSPSPEIWSVLCEKAYAKLYGSYAAIEGGDVAIAMVDMCGGVPFEHKMGARCAGSKYGGIDGRGMARMWIDLQKWRREHAMVGVSWAAAGGTDSEQYRGTFGNHAYGVLDCYTVHGPEGAEQLVKLRNPHGHGGEYTGDWRDSDVRWKHVPAEDKNRMGHVDADDGMFFMRLKDFYELFEDVAVCRPLQPTPYMATDWNVWHVAGEWAGSSAQGFSVAAVDARSVDQFQVTLHCDCELVVCLAQPSARLTTLECVAVPPAVISPCTRALVLRHSAVAATATAVSSRERESRPFTHLPSLCPPSRRRTTRALQIHPTRVRRNKGQCRGRAERGVLRDKPGRRRTRPFACARRLRGVRSHR